jgi:hypothetical protein
MGSATQTSTPPTASERTGDAHELHDARERDRDAELGLDGLHDAAETAVREHGVHLDAVLLGERAARILGVGALGHVDEHVAREADDRGVRVVLGDVHEHRDVVEDGGLLFGVAESLALALAAVAAHDEEVHAALHRADIGHALEHFLVAEGHGGLHGAREVPCGVGRDGEPEIRVTATTDAATFATVFHALWVFNRPWRATEGVFAARREL